MLKFFSRIEKEKKQIINNVIDGIFLLPSLKNKRYFFLIIGSQKIPIFSFHSNIIEIYLPLTYPLKPPIISFFSHTNHPNIDSLGRPCVDILKDGWSPALQIRTLVLSIQSFICNPNFNDPLDQKISKMFQKKMMIKNLKKIIYILNDTYTPF
mmetsp:Transcript_43485/g.103366  ORF Transcript_43485/g.103366 Transcript_43485/m.103366 type:complete len:153 (+) Transcript_43485:590-1048(+)